MVILKRSGISPLVGAVVLVGLVIAMGLVVSSFLTGFTQESKIKVEQKGEKSVTCGGAQLFIDEDSISIGKSPQFFYQEDANSTSVVDYYFYMNYTKPNDAYSLSKWKVKHGNISSYNITLPENCWNTDPNKLILRMYSLASSSVSSYPQCYNGSNWITIGNTVLFTHSSIIAFSDEGNDTLYDENWNTYAAYRGDSYNKWYTNVQDDGIYARIYEEAIYWYIELNDNISIDIENIGQTDLSKLKIVAYNETGVYTYNAMPSSILRGTKVTIVSDGAPQGTITKIKVYSEDCPGVEAVAEKEDNKWETTG